MSKRKRKPHRVRRGRHRPSVAPKGSRAPQAPKPQEGVSRGAEPTNAGNEAKDPKYGWVTVEYRDSDGNPTLPRKLIASTYKRLYEQVPPESEIKVHVLAGYKPRPLMLVERKIYEIYRLSVQGLRRRGQIAVEVEGWRQHEADWFNAMRGVKLNITDPALPGPHNEDSDYIISESSFTRKIVTLLDGKGNETKVELHEGTLDITETWKSAWGRQKAEIINLGIKLLLIPLFVALGAGLALLWVDRFPTSSNVDSDLPGTPAQHEGQIPDRDLESEPLEDVGTGELPGIQAPVSAGDTLELSDYPLEGRAVREEPKL